MHVKLLLPFLLCMHLDLSGQAATNAPVNIWATEISADGKWLALGGDDSTVWVYATDNYSLQQSYQLNSMVRGLSWHPKEPLLAIATTDGISFLSLPDKQVLDVSSIKTGGRAIAWNPTGEMLALADGAGVLQILNKEGKLLRSISKHNDHSYLTVDWHPTKNILVTGSDEVILFDTSGKQLKLFRHRDMGTGILTIRWHPSGEFFALGDYGHDKEGIPTLLQFWKEDGTLLKEMRGLSRSEYRNIRWNHNGTMLGTASDALRIWSKEGKLLSTAASGSVWGIAWSKDDTRLITGSFDNGSVKIWSSSGALIRRVH